MTHFKYHKISKNTKIRLICNTYQDAPFIVFLHGFMSDLEGKKPKFFLNFAKKNNLGFLAIEYSGHGKSSGEFTNGNISKWTEEVRLLIKKVVKKNDIIFVGSSMGSWISLNLFKFFEKKIKGFLGIGSAPEFLDNLMWNKFSKKMKKEIKTNKKILLKHGEYQYPITLQLIRDGRKNKVLTKSIINNINVTMVHGNKDKSVPVIYSRKVLKIFKNAKKKLVIIKNGDHSLSKPKYLNLLREELKLIIS